MAEAKAKSDWLPRCTTCGEQKAPRNEWIGIEVWAMCHKDRGCPGYEQEPDPGDYWPANGETK